MAKFAGSSFPITVNEIVPVCVPLTVAKRSLLDCHRLSAIVCFYSLFFPFFSVPVIRVILNKYFKKKDQNHIEICLKASVVLCLMVRSICVLK